MATLIVRDVDEGTKARLVQRAAQHGRSMESEVRSILKAATDESTWITEWLDLVPGFSGVDLVLPPRSMPRELNLFEEE